MASDRIVGACLGMLMFVCTAAPAAAAPHRGPACPVAPCKDAYLVSRDGSFLSTNVSMDDVGSVRGRFSGTFFWFRREGKEYLVRDRAAIAEVQALFEPLSETEPERAALERRQARLEEEQAAIDRDEEAIDREQDELFDDADLEASATGDSDRRDLERRRHEVESRRRELEGQERELEAVERSIDRRDEELESKAESELWEWADRAIARGQVQSLAGSKD